jgi:hypothetical protein
MQFTPAVVAVPAGVSLRWLGTPAFPNDVVTLGALDDIFNDPAGLVLAAPLYINIPTGLGNIAGDEQISAVFTVPDANMEHLVLKSYRISNGTAHDTAVTMIHRVVDTTAHAFLALATGDSAFPVGWGLGYGAGGSGNYQLWSNPNGNMGTNPPATGYTLQLLGNNMANGANGTQVAALRLTGSFGGGMAWEDGVNTTGIWMASGTWILGTNNGGGAAGGLTPRITVSTSSGDVDLGGTVYCNDLHTDRGDHTGVVFLGNQSGGGRYIYYNGTYFEFQGAPVVLTAGTVSASGFIVTSKRELKTDIEYCAHGALDRIMNIPLYEFSFKHDEHKRRHVGTMVDELIGRYTDGEGVIMENIVFDMLQAIKELERKITPRRH